MEGINEHIFLIGFMGVGKSSTSRLLSHMLNVKEVDTDALVVEKEGCQISEIFANKGEEYFRNLETGILDDIKEIEPCIVSCGGGLALRQENVKKMRGMGRIILLSASPETIYIHVKDSLSRPLLNGNMNIPYIKKLMDARIPKYLDAADTIIETDGLSLKEVAAKIADLYT